MDFVPVRQIDPSFAPGYRIDARKQPRYISLVLLPFDREKLRERNDIDNDDERGRASDCSPEKGFLDTLEVSELVRDLAEATSGDSSDADDLAAKAKLFVLPLRAAQRS